jgi:predicted transcriptional regulator
MKYERVSRVDWKGRKVVTSVVIDGEQARALRELAEREGRSQSQIVRLALRTYLVTRTIAEETPRAG